ncbi:6-bladed beta-propeller [Proteiniphilum saccharofermentans]|uniref:6-bladed beta-propeller n=1 Tax=Proteiniphilum saccharofermentans TaxID=1642647 RepID=UPI0028ADF1C6|nr:6-bladed beta-propeller [Proteiniphilum saccharofermentans]
MERGLLFHLRGTLLLSLALLTSCNKHKGQSAFDQLDVVAEKVMVGNSELISCDLTRLKDTVEIPLSFLVEDLRMVKLDNRDEALVGNSFTTVTDKHILVRNNRQNPYKLFNIQGEFLTTIGTYGQGPYEYLNVYYDWLDEETGQIFILPWQSNQLLRFDLQGNPLETVPLKYSAPKGKFFVHNKESTVSVFLLPFHNIPVVAWTQDFNGNMIDSIPSGHLAVPLEFGNEIYSNRNMHHFDCFLFTFYEQRPDSLYHYNMIENRLDPKFTLDFKGKPWKIHWYEELPRHFIGTLTVEKKLSEYAIVTEYPAKFIVDKETLKGGFYKLHNDFLGGIPINWPSFHNGYYVWNVDPGELTEHLTQHMDKSKTLTENDRKKLTDLLGSIDENDNNYLFYGKLRQN